VTEPVPPSRSRLALGRRAFDSAYARADRALDRGQHHVFRFLWFFLPDTSIARDARFQAIMASRFFSDAGQQALTYGALIAVVRGGGSAFEAALVGAAAILPPALFGLYGGAVADQLPKRVALAAIYNLQALLCIFVPLLFGTGLPAVLFLIFAVHTLGQVSGPSEGSVIPLVATQEQLASAASFIALASNVGTAFGTALLAPILVRVFGEQAVFIVAGVMLALAASRVFDLSTRQPEPAAAQRFDWRRRPRLDVRGTLRWLAHERAVATMMFVAVLAGTASIVVQTLAPRYVSAVLGVDPADAVYVFGPSAIGLLIALAVTPALIRRIGERFVALGGFVLTTAVLLLLGLLDHDLADLIAPVNPVRLLEVFGLSIDDELEAAGALAIVLGFGLTITATSVHTYINRRVPLAYQGRAFALQTTLKNGTAIVPLLTLGGAATVFGTANVLTVAPLVLLALAFLLVRLSFAFAGHAPHGQLDVFASFWEESESPVVAPPDRGRPPRGGSGAAQAAQEPREDGEHQGAERGREGDALSRPGADEQLAL